MTWSNPTVSPTLPGVHFFSNILTTYPAIFCLCFLSYTCAHVLRECYTSWRCRGEIAHHTPCHSETFHDLQYLCYSIRTNCARTVIPNDYSVRNHETIV